MNIRNHLHKLWNNVFSDEKELFIKENQIKQFFNEQHLIQKTRNIYDSDWINTIPTNSLLTRVTKGELLPESVNYNTYIDLDIPSIFIPFLNINILTKTTQEVQCVGNSPYIYETYESDYFEVYGNGSNLIYKGFPHDIYYFYSQSDLDDEYFQEDYTKKTYRAVIYYSQLGSEYKIDGTLIQTIVRENGEIKGGNQEYDEWEAHIDPGYVAFLNYSNYHNIDNTEVNFTTRRKEVRYTVNPSPPPDYFQQTTYYDNGGYGFRVTKQWASVDREYHKLKTASKYKKIDGLWVLQSSGDFTVDTEDGQIITERDFSFKGYWLFYSPDTRYLFGIRDVFPVVVEGIYNKKELINLPEDPYRFWNYILFKRNPEPRPEKIQSSGIIGGSNQYVFFKKEENKYRIFLKGKLVFTAKANILNPPPAQKTSGDHRQVPEYSDTYYQYDTSYIATEIHTLKNRDFFGSANEDIQYKIKIDVTNPLYWKELKNYAI